MKAKRVRVWWRGAGWLGVLAVAVVSLLPVPPEAVDAAGGDKLLHLAGYGALAWWFGQLQPAAGLLRWRVAAGLTLLGAALEGAQYLVPWRSTEGWDLAADAGGAVLGLAVAGWRRARPLDRVNRAVPPTGSP